MADLDKEQSSTMSSSTSDKDSCQPQPGGGNTSSQHTNEQDSSNSKAGSSSSTSSSKNGDSAVAGSINNPFARPTSQATWGQDPSENKPVLAPSKLGGSEASVRPGILRPSSLGASGSSGSVRRFPSASLFVPPTLTVTSPPSAKKPMFQLKPSVLTAGGGGGGGPTPSNNPFARVPTTVTEEPDSNTPSTTDKKSSSTSSQNGSVSQQDTFNGEASSLKPEVTSSSSSNSGVDTRSTPAAVSSSDAESQPSAAVDGIGGVTSTTSQTNSSPSSNIFMPLNVNNRISLNNNSASNNSSTSTVNGLASSTTSNSQFIFGQNLQSRINVNKDGTTSEASNGEAEPKTAFTEAASASNSAAAAFGNNTFSSSASNERTGNLFSEAASGLNKNSEEGAWSSGKSLVETSRELTEKENSQKRKFEEVEVITGEESESNVLQMNCKLYGWVAGSWQERGRGILRLNDWNLRKELHSRLVIRTQGTLTVMLNTQIWAGMSVERASQKSVRFTASDADGQPKIFLVMASPKDIDTLYNSLEWRVATSRSHSQDATEDSENAKKSKTDYSCSSTEPPPYDEATD